MPEDDLIKIISSIGVNYQPAIQSAQEFAKSLENLNVVSIPHRYAENTEC